MDGENHAAAETVVVAAVLRGADQTEFLEERDVEAFSDGGFGQGVALVECVTQAESLAGLVGHAALGEILQTDVAAFVGGGQVFFHLLHGPFVGEIHSFAPGLLPPLLISQFLLLNLDSIFLRKL